MADGANLKQQSIGSHMISNTDWERAIKIIELESNLANHRYSGLLTLQGFLFAATTFSLSGLAKIESTQPAAAFSLLALVLIACLVGAISPWLVQSGLIAAYRQIAASAYWLELRALDQECGDHPPIVGCPINTEYKIGDSSRTSKASVSRLTVGILFLPKLLSCVWTVLAFLIVFFNFRYVMCTWHALLLQHW